jgi:hypothetical protein
VERRRALLLAATGAVGISVARRRRARRAAGGPAAIGLRGPEAWRRRISSHEAFTHDSLDSLGYDWSRIADPHVRPRYPLKVLLTQTTDDVVRMIQQAKRDGETLVVRSKGHSSNDLVLADRGSVLMTEHLHGEIHLDEAALTVAVQGGQVSAALDDWLAERGYGLPVIGDHNHITVAGFASVGGINPGGHRHGMFVDNVVSLELVDWDGRLRTCSGTENTDLFHAVLMGLGRHGVITAMTLRVERIDKYGTILENDQRHYRTLEEFLVEARPFVVDPPEDVRLLRGLFADFLLPGGRRVGLGQLSMYRDTPQTEWARGWDAIVYWKLHRLGWVSGRLPRALDRGLKMAGFASVLWAPRYARIKNVETFADKVLDATVGDPTRFLVVLAPHDRYVEVARRLFDLLVDYRDRFRCMTFVALYVKSIRSAYLGHGEPAGFCELLFDIGIDHRGMTDVVLDALVEEIDDACIEMGAFRYLHSKTTKDPAKRRLLDPNTYYADRLAKPSPRRRAKVSP